MKKILLTICLSAVSCAINAAQDLQTLKDQNLISAAQNGDVATAIQALEAGANVNAVDLSWGAFTALHYAAWLGNDTMVKLLLDRSADRDIKSALGGHTALHSAIHQGHTNIVQMLLAKGAKPNIINNELEVPLGSAVIGEHTTIVKTLLSFGASTEYLPPHLRPKIKEQLKLTLNDAACDSMTPLMWSVITGDKERVKVLLDASSASHTNSDNSTALMLAHEYKQGEIAQAIDNSIKLAEVAIARNTALISGIIKLIGEYTYGYKK